jgi:hypothetical protein
MLPDQVDRGVDEERAEHVEQPAEPLQRGGPQRDEQTPHDQREHDSDEQHLVLVRPWHREPAHDDEEDEQVVHAQAVFGDVPGEELACLVGPEHRPQAHPEQPGECDVEGDPVPGLPHGELTSLAAIDDPEVDGEDDQQTADDGDPGPHGYGHVFKPSGMHDSLPEVSPARSKRGPAAPGAPWSGAAP